MKDLSRYLLNLIVVVLVVFLGYRVLTVPNFFQSGPDFEMENGETAEVKESQPEIEIVAENLQIPWEIAFLPTDEILVTERVGNLLKIGKDRKIIQIEGVKHQGEGGLLGMVMHPDFEKNQWIYLYFTTVQGTVLENRVERYKLANDELTEKTVILEKIPGANYHDGGRIAFGPDGYLYITTGDASSSNLAQNKKSLAGKILRVQEDGSVPKDNPFGNEVYSYGHRNPQGLTWDTGGRLWATEHGRSGVLSGFDELNLIEPGANYGWPTIEGDGGKRGMVKAIINSGAYETWAPAAIVYYDGRLFFTGLKGEALYEAKISNNKIEKLTKHFSGEYGRLRALQIHDDYLYFTTSNTDGRGDENEGDDKLIRVPLGNF